MGYFKRLSARSRIPHRIPRLNLAGKVALIRTFNFEMSTLCFMISPFHLTNPLFFFISMTLRCLNSPGSHFPLIDIS